METGYIALAILFLTVQVVATVVALQLEAETRTQRVLLSFLVWLVPLLGVGVVILLRVLERRARGQSEEPGRLETSEIHAELEARDGGSGLQLQTGAAAAMGGGEHSVTRAVGILGSIVLWFVGSALLLLLCILSVNAIIMQAAIGVSLACIIATAVCFGLKRQRLAFLLAGTPMMLVFVLMLAPLFILAADVLSTKLK